MEQDNQKFWGITPDNERRAYEIARWIGKPRVIVDLCCGKGFTISKLQELFPNTKCIGVDIEEYPEWKDSKATMLKMSLQEFIKKPGRYDVVLMLNSYREWEGFHKEWFNDWLAKNARLFITSTNLPYPKRVIGKDVRQIDMELYIIEDGVPAYEQEVKVPTIREQFKTFSESLTVCLDTWHPGNDYMEMEECVPIMDRCELVGMCYYKKSKLGKEMGIIVHRDHQNKGLGKMALEHLEKIAKSKGEPDLAAKVLAGNDRMMKVLENSGWKTEFECYKYKIYRKIL